MKQSCIVNAQRVMKMSFPQSLSGNPEDKRTGFPCIKYGAGSVKHGMTVRRGFSGKVSNSKSQVPSFQTPNCSLFTNRGFTLIETIIVMVVVAILAAVVIIRNPFDSIKLSSATRKVAGDIRYVQKLAISNQTRAGMEFNGNYGYSVYRDMTGGPYLPATSPGDPCSTDTSNNFVVNFTDPRCSNYSGVTIATTLPLSIVKFDSLGTPYDGNNSLLVAGNNTIRLSLSGVPDETITIQAGTGRVYIP